MIQTQRRGCALGSHPSSTWKRQLWLESREQMEEGEGGRSRHGQGFWLLLATALRPLYTSLSLHRQAGPLGSVCRAMAGHCSGDTRVCLGLLDQGEDKEGQGRGLVALTPATRKGCPVGLGEVRVRREKELPLSPRGSFFCSQAWRAGQAAQVVKKGNGRKEERK